LAFSDQEISVFLTSAIQSYIFNYVFEQKNPGFEFDAERWVEEIQKLAPNGLTVMNAATVEKLQNLINDLDNFKKFK